MQVSAAIVAYNPDERLTALARTVVAAGVPCHVIDNASRHSEVLTDCENLGAKVTRLSENTGVAGALALALDETDADWLLTFDQDSEPLPGFVRSLTESAALDDPRCGAVGPIVLDAETREPLQGDPAEVMVTSTRRLLTSGTLGRVAAMRAVGGFRRDLVIDLVDWDLCLRLRAAGWELAIEPGAVLLHAIGDATRHHVPVLGDVTTTNHSPDRQYYKARNFTRLAREGALTAEPRWALRTAVGLALSAAKIVAFERQKGPKLRALGQGFADGVRGRGGVRGHVAGGPAAGEPRTGRAPVSVCMATYNGAEFLAEQVDSILAQLGPDDELLVTDDASTDDTVERLAAYGDPRMHVERGSVNRGHIATFERVLSRARHEIVFMSDQDDEWLPGKVDAVVAWFADPGVMGVVTDADIVTDGVVTGSFFDHARSGPGVVHNFVKNSYLGCCMAVRRSVLDVALPIPREIRTHDGWIGITADMLGDVVFLDTPYVRYRRHGHNVSQMERFGLADIVKRRLFLARELVRIGPSVLARRGRTG